MQHSVEQWLVVLTCLYTLVLSRLNRHRLLAKPVLFLHLGLPSLLQVAISKRLHTHILAFNFSIFFLFLSEKVCSVLLKPPVYVLQAFHKNIEFDVFSFDKFLGHLQAIKCLERSNEMRREIVTYFIGYSPSVSSFSALWISSMILFCSYLVSLSPSLAFLALPFFFPPIFILT